MILVIGSCIQEQIGTLNNIRFIQQKSRSKNGFFVG